MPVLRSSGCANSAEIIVYLHRCFVQNELSFDAAHAAVALAGTGSKRKRDNLDDPAVVLCQMLSVIPGVSSTKASAIIAKFPSLGSLCESKVSELSEIQCGSKRLGKALATRIHAMLTYSA